MNFWAERRWSFNVAFVGAGVIAIPLDYVLEGLAQTGAQTDSDRVVALFQVLVQPIALLVANLIYSCVAAVDRLVPETRRARFRLLGYRAVVGVSTAVQLTLPMLVLADLLRSGPATPII